MPYADPDAQRAYQAHWLAQRRADWIAENGPCQGCGTWEDLQVDHRDRTEKVSHRVWSWSAARRLAELAKCQVLCAPCHWAKTVGEVHPHAFEHGRGLYRRGCRCIVCRVAYAARRST